MDPPGMHLTREEVAAVQAIVTGTAGATGVEFFRTLVRLLASTLNVRYAFIAELKDAYSARTLALWARDGIVPDMAWDVRGTPCEDVVRGSLCHYPSGVTQRFPDDKPLAEMGIQSYLGIPLRDEHHATLGHLAVFDDRPMPADPRQAFLLRIFADRATAELLRLRDAERLRESEQRFRDLFDEAPIAYVHEDLDSRFISANRAAMRILGITPEQVPGAIGMSFIPDTPDAQRRVREAFESINRGTDTAGVVLELRRKDNGKPIWIQWWSKPDPSGQYTRTMFIDITEQVLMEQERARLLAQNQYLREEIKSVHNFEEIIGRSPPLLSVLDRVKRVAPTDATVLILGETGTGKELIARAIHSESPRRDKPLIKINCAALPAGLVESELFGHERGAFSGALTKRVGRFELAHGGTIFLDEIGEIPPDVQVKLLRVLQEHEIDRVGGSVPIHVDVRVIAATNRDLGKAVADGTFRGDLYYRLNVFPVHVPPLRERREDISLLVGFLVDKFAARVGKPAGRVEPEIMRRLMDYSWPGNVRELENILERAVILSSGPTIEIDPAALAAASVAATPHPSGASNTASSPSERPTLESVSRQHILDALKATKWVIDGSRGAAQALGLHPNTLRSRLKKLGITRPSDAKS